MKYIEEFVCQLLGESFISADIEELKTEIIEHLKEEIFYLKENGLSEKEAFIIAKDRFADQNIIDDFLELTSYKNIEEKKPLTNLLVIGCSTGGPKALKHIFSNLSNKLNVCILVVQHISKGYSSSLAHLLNESSQLDIKEAKTGDILEDGNVFIAKAGYHMKVKKIANQYIIENFLAEKRGNTPSVDETLYSLSTIDVPLYVSILTGMGNDGTNGLEQLKLVNKPKVIAESEKSAVIYGMPKQVIKRGLADYILDLDDMASFIEKLMGSESISKSIQENKDILIASGSLLNRAMIRSIVTKINPSITVNSVINEEEMFKKMKEKNYDLILSTFKVESFNRLSNFFYLFAETKEEFDNIESKLIPLLF